MTIQTNATENLIRRFDEDAERFDAAVEAGSYRVAMTQADRMLAIAHDIPAGEAYREAAFDAMGTMHQWRTERSLES